MAKEKKAKATTEAEENEAKVDEVKEPAAEEKLQAELNEAKDQLLRVAAEYDNFRKRSQREKESLYSECKSSVVNDLLPVIDNFERCVAPGEDTSYEDYKKGVELTYKQFGEALKKLGIEAFGEVGDAFDPNLHNAVMHTEDESFGENTISMVFQKGFRVGEKVVRFAMVQVAN